MLRTFCRREQMKIRVISSIVLKPLCLISFSFMSILNSFFYFRALFTVLLKINTFKLSQKKFGSLGHILLCPLRSDFKEDGRAWSCLS